MVQPSQAIAIHPGTPLGETDRRTHFWYQLPSGELHRLCDDAKWPDNTPPRSNNSTIDIPCLKCRDLYLEDTICGRQALIPHALMDSPPDSMVYSLKLWGYPLIEEIRHMEIDTQPMTAFARFFEATPSQKVRMVRDARLFQSDPGGYIQRAYYGAFRNALRQTHWIGHDLATFEAKLEDVVAELRLTGKQPAKLEHYKELGESYVGYWRQYPDLEVFEVPTAETEIAGLKIRITGDVGMRFGGDEYALEPYFRAPRPTRLFRQAVQYITEQARQGVWNPNWVANIYDARRRLLLQELRVRPQDLRIGLDGAAADFQQIWQSLEL